MSEDIGLDRLILGRRVRHYRKEAGLTLDQVSGKVGRPTPYLSLLENGHKEPRLSLMVDLSDALGVELSVLLEPTAPTRRDHLEIELIRAQTTALFDSLGVPPLKPSARLDNEILAHLVGVHAALRERSSIGHAGSEEVRRANGAVATALTGRNGYLGEVEDTAADALHMAGYSGEGPVTSRNLTDLAAKTGFTIEPIDDMPAFARSIVDLEGQRIFIAQRDELRTRQARKAVLQTLGGFLLGHEREPDLHTYLWQRVETAYLAAAVLAPEAQVVARIAHAKEGFDIDAEDIKELFYISYEMAAWRTANLLTEHFGIRSHMLVSDETGIVLKGYANDGLPVSRDPHGGMETQRLCRRWGSRVTFDSPERYADHHQYTDTSAGTFFCTTHVEPGAHPAQAITLGVGFGDARWFRGRDTEIRETSTCPDPTCCRIPSPDLSAKWDDKVLISARSQARILGLMAADPYPETDLPEVLRVVEGH